MFDLRILFVAATTSFSVAEGLQMLIKMQDFVTSVLFLYLEAGPSLSDVLRRRYLAVTLQHRDYCTPMTVEHY